MFMKRKFKLVKNFKPGDTMWLNNLSFLVLNKKYYNSEGFYCYDILRKNCDRFVITTHNKQIWQTLVDSTE